MIDLDPQGNSSRYLLGALADAEHAEAPGAAGFFETDAEVQHARAEDEPISSSPRPATNLHLMPAGAALDELHGKLESRYKIYKLRDALLELGGQTTTRSG